MASNRELILVVDDEPEVADLHVAMLKSVGYPAIRETNPVSALRLLAEDKTIRLVLTDLRMPEMLGSDLLREIRVRFPSVGVILATVVNDVTQAVEATRFGAFNYLLKPLQSERLLRTVQAYFGNRPPLPQSDPRLASLVTNSAAMEPVFKRILAFAEQEVPVLITGESGTGKEIVAGMIHGISSRREGRYVPINCAAIATSVFESEFFGHVRGAFTGAGADKKGYLEAAGGGSLFLDEIGELSLDMQAKLLRVLQDRSFYKVGSSQRTAVDTRLIFATNRDLRSEIQAGRFREDLYYRLSAHIINIPPLRERFGDIATLGRYFLKKYTSQYGRFLEGFTDDALMYLERYPFPGNVRELEGIVSAAILLEESLYVTPESLPLTVTGGISPCPMITGGDDEIPNADLRGVRKQMILDTLKDCQGNQTQAAKKLGINRVSLNRILRRLREDGDST